MTPELNKTERLPDDDGPDVTQRISAGAAEQPDGAEPAEHKTAFSSLRESYMRARDGRKRGQPEKPSRSAKSVDRSKGLLALAVAVIILIFVFLGMFSSSSGTKDGAANRTKPSLGRPDLAAGAAEKRGSVTPLLSADMSGQDGNNDQLSADDVKATGRLRVRTQMKPGNTLASVPPMDPALDAYRQAQTASTVPQAPPPAASAPVPAPPVASAHNEADALKKSSLVFVSNNSGASASAIRPASMTAEPALLERKATALLPNGSRLMARLQSAVSTAVKGPVVAAIEYNYERDGEIIIPAGTKAFGTLQQANRNGDIGIHFHTLQMPDGATEKIDAGSMSLTYGPLKGSLSGGNAVKRILVRSLTGVGTMAAYLVGGPGGLGGASGDLNNSVLLRERIASNAGLAGEQEFQGLASNENIVVSVPGNTRFFIVLLEGSGETAAGRTVPAGSRGTTQVASDGTSRLTSQMPSAQELRELIELKAQLNRMYQDVGTAQTTMQTVGPPAPSQQQ
jgi:type IV secretory pathway VirB10-like protein